MKNGLKLRLLKTCSGGMLNDDIMISLGACGSDQDVSARRRKRMLSFLS